MIFWKWFKPSYSASLLKWPGSLRRFFHFLQQNKNRGFFHILRKTEIRKSHIFTFSMIFDDFWSFFKLCGSYPGRNIEFENYEKHCETVVLLRECRQGLNPSERGASSCLRKRKTTLKHLCSLLVRTTSTERNDCSTVFLVKERMIKASESLMLSKMLHFQRENEPQNRGYRLQFPWNWFYLKINWKINWNYGSDPGRNVPTRVGTSEMLHFQRENEN